MIRVAGKSRKYESWRRTEGIIKVFIFNGTQKSQYFFLDLNLIYIYHQCFYLYKTLNKISMDSFNICEDPFSCDFGMDHSDEKILAFTADSIEHPMLRIVQDDSIFEDSNRVFCKFFAEMPMEDQLSQEVINVERTDDKPDGQPEPQEKKRSTPKTKKNSNAIKKMGRIIMNNLAQYDLPSQENSGVKKMLQKLQERHTKKAKTMVDGFNTYHLEALFDTKEEVSRFNLKTTRKIFTKLLRNEVLDSFQIKGESKLLYLKTLKCSSLRFMNRKLANRLQTSENQQ